VLEGLLDEEGIALGLLVEGQHQGPGDLVLSQDGDKLLDLRLPQALEGELQKPEISAGQPECSVLSYERHE
jgi:hypothetical protein